VIVSIVAFIVLDRCRAVPPSPANSVRMITKEDRILVRIAKFPTLVLIDKVRVSP
jgi:hypothetical protein